MRFTASSFLFALEPFGHLAEETAMEATKGDKINACCITSLNTKHANIINGIKMEHANSYELYRVVQRTCEYFPNPSCHVSSAFAKGPL